ncbi:HupE/UreJ family protein [Stella sp.]|uniref:HupE/UreJ family protein n=1 Tax=Stella sp. TaxID=2912054 RepID=UPI0035B11E16
MVIKAILAGAAWVLTPTLALAHHAMGGQLPDGPLTGLLSGLGHPVIGIDHLAFVVGIGVLSASARLGSGPLLGFVGGTLAGCLLHVAGAELPLAEAAVALSLLVMAGLLALGRSPAPGRLLVLAAAGLAHGYAYGESIVGAEPVAVGAYLVGFSLVQAAIALGAAGLVRSLAAAAPGRLAAAANLSAVLLVLVGGALLIG